jgi:phosphoribosylanthranilate isomerase
MDRLFVKICGVTNADDANCAFENGADAIGFNFYPSSKRYIVPEKAREISEVLNISILRVGVFVNPARDYVNAMIQEVAVNAIQFSGDETPDDVSGYQLKVFKAIHVTDVESLAAMKLYGVEAFLLDTHRDGEFGGTGETFDWDVARKAKQFGKVILAGGLTPQNVSAAVRLARPYGVDVSSGVELKPGIKDHKKIRDFVRRAREEHAQHRAYEI